MKGRLLGVGVVSALALAAACLPAACKGNAPSTPSPSGTCGGSQSATATGAAWTPAADPAQPVQVTFTVTIDPTNPVLTGQWLEPHPEALSIQGGSNGLSLWGGVKTYANHSTRFGVELYLVNDGTTGLAAVTANVSNIAGSSTFYDLNADPLASATSPAPMTLGGVAPEGVSTHLRFGFDADTSNDPISFTLSLSGTTTTRVSTTSSPVAITPDGTEAWAAFADGNVAAVIDTATDKRVAQVALGAQPSSLAITPDGALVLVTSADCNTLTVIDRATRQPVQVFAESDGIGRDPRNVVLSPDGTHAYVSAYVSDTVTVLERDTDGFRVTGNVAVGRRPTGMSVTPDGSTLMVAHYLPRGELDANEGWISLVATDTLSVAAETTLEDNGNTTLAGCLTQIQGFNQYQPSDMRFEGVPTELAGIFLDPSGSTGWVPLLRPAGFPIFEGNPQSLQNIGFTNVKIGANSSMGLFPIDARNPRTAVPMPMPSLPDITDRTEPFLECRQDPEVVDAVSSSPVAGSQGEYTYPGTANPSSSTQLSETGVSRFVGFTRGGRRALVLSYNADELLVLDAATHSPTSYHYLLLSGSNPVGIAVTPDGTKGYVVYENSTFASVLNLSAYTGSTLPTPSFLPYAMVPGAPGQGAGLDTFLLVERDLTTVPDQPSVQEVTTVPLVDQDPMDPVMRRGKVLFTSSSPVKYPTLSGDREASCSSCHPNGGNDGTVWSTMEGERRTIALTGGVAGRGWLHASGTHQDITTFATIIVQQRLGGTGLSPSDQTALEGYVARGIPNLQSPAVDPTLAATGEALFNQYCSSCHQGEKLTSGEPDPSNQWGGGGDAGPNLLDVGSATPWAGALIGAAYANLLPTSAKDIFLDLRGDRELGPNDPVQQQLQFSPRPERAAGQLKAPSLMNIWDDNLFFHDGRQDSLTDAINDIAPRIGATLTSDQVNALAAYLTTL